MKINLMSLFILYYSILHHIIVIFKPKYFVSLPSEFRVRYEELLLCNMSWGEVNDNSACICNSHEFVLVCRG